MQADTGLDILLFATFLHGKEPFNMKIHMLLTHYQTTNLRLIQTEFADDNLKYDENGRNLSKRVKICWKKEKLLLTSNFSFSHSVFKRLVSQGCQKVSLCGNGLTLYHTVATFNNPCQEAFEKHSGGKNAKCFQFGLCLNLVV